MSDKISLELDKTKTVSFILVVLTILLSANAYLLYDMNKKMGEYEKEFPHLESTLEEVNQKSDSNEKYVEEQRKRIEELEEEMRRLNRTVQLEKQ